MKGLLCQDHSPMSSWASGLQTEAAGRLDRCPAVLVRGPPRKVVGDRLMVPDRPQESSDDDFGLRFGTELDAPRASLGIANVVAGAEAVLVHLQNGVARSRIWQQRAAARTVKQVSLLEIRGSCQSSAISRWLRV